MGISPLSVSSIRTKIPSCRCIVKAVIAALISLFLISYFSFAYAEDVSASASSLLERGIQLLNENRPDEAIKVLEEAASLEPNNPLPFYYLGTAYHLKHDNVSALNNLNKAISIEPGMPLALLRTGIILEELGRLDLAVSAFKALVDKGGDRPQVKEAGERYKRVASILHYRKGVRLYQEKRYEESLKELKESITINPENADAQFAAGMTYQRLSKFNEAIESFKKVVAIDPSNTTALLMLGNLYKAMAMYEDAITTLKQIISIATGTSQAKEAEKGLPEIEKRLETRKHFEMAAGFIRKEKWQEALEETKIVLASEEANPNALFNLGVILHNLKEDEQAIEALKKAVDIDPRNQKAYYQLGAIYEETNKFKEGIEAYRFVVAINEKSADAVKAKEKIDALTPFMKAEEKVSSIKEYMKKDDIAGAVKELEGMLLVKGDDPDIYLTLATLYLKVARIKDAVFALEKASTLSPNDVDIRLLLGKAYEGLNEYVKAAEVYNYIASMEKDTPRGKEAEIKAKKFTVLLHLQKGKAYLAAGRYEESLQEMKEVVKLTPDDSVALFNIGVLYYRLNVPEDAELPLMQAISLDPGYIIAHLQLGLVYEKVAKFDKAKEEFGKVIELQKEGKETDVARTRIKYLKEYKELSEHLDLAINYMKEKKWENARKEIDSILLANPGNYIGHYYKGIILFQEGIEDEAKAELKKAIEIKPEYFPAYLRLGDIFLKEYAFEDARKYYQEVITLGKDSPEAEIASDSLKRLKAWWVSFYMKHGYNSNIAFRSKANASAQSGYVLGLNYSMIRQKDWNLSTSLAFNESIYYSTQLSGNGYSIQLNGSRLFPEDRSISSSGSYSKSFFDGKPTSVKKSFSVSAQTSPRTIPTSASLSYNGSISTYYKKKLSDAEQHSFTLSVSQKLSLRDSLSGSYQFSIYKNLNLIASNYANRINTISASYSRTLTSIIGFNLGYSISFIDYSNPDSTTLYQQFRHNTSQSLNSGLSLNLSEDVSISFTYGFSYGISHTNLPQLSAEERQKLEDILATPIPTVGGGGGFYQHDAGISLSTTF